VAAIVAAKIVILVVRSAPDAVIVPRVLSLATQPEVPEITFTGPVDDALPAEVADQLIDMLRLALGPTGMHTGPASIRVEAGESPQRQRDRNRRDPAGPEPAGPARPRGGHRDEGPPTTRRTALTGGHAPGSGWD
jgi:hypothetical protein